LKASRIDSLDEVEEENKAEPPVVIDRRGAARSGGAMAGRRCTVGFLPCVASTWRRRKRKGESGGAEAWWLA
jgi:hypothetical protein